MWCGVFSTQCCAGPLPREHAQQACKVAVGRDEILPFEPRGVGRYVQRRLRSLAREAEVEQQHVLLRRFGLDRMHGEELRREPSQAALGVARRRAGAGSSPCGLRPSAERGSAPPTPEAPARVGSAASRRCSSVVPVRCSPAITIGRSIGICSISGCSRISASTRRRFASMPTMRPRMIARPSGCSCCLILERAQQHAAAARGSRDRRSRESPRLSTRGLEQALELERALDPRVRGHATDEVERAHQPLDGPDGRSRSR